MRYRRVFTPGATYFFTVNLQNRRSDLLIKEIDNLRFAFRKTKEYYPFTIESIVILPDHLHMIMTLPKDESNYSLRWNFIKGFFSKQIQSIEPISRIQKKKRERGIWQKRFWEHLIRDEKDFESHVNYIHYNPVKHKYVTKPTEWPYSSIHQFIKKGIITNAWTCQENFKLNGFGE